MFLLKEYVCIYMGEIWMVIIVLDLYMGVLVFFILVMKFISVILFLNVLYSYINIL